MCLTFQSNPMETKSLKWVTLQILKEHLKTQAVFQGSMGSMQFLFQSPKELVSMNWTLLKL